jgi:predicted RNA-binding Zn-ribbon protein involved in translation (DUF1610 family)
VSKEKLQHCDFCGKEIGVFAHSRNWDGPLSCGETQCTRDERDTVRQEYEEKRERAFLDDFERY